MVRKNGGTDDRHIEWCAKMTEPIDHVTRASQNHKYGRYEHSLRFKHRIEITENF